MNYKVNAIGTIELKRFVGTVDYELCKEFDIEQPTSFADIASVYDGGKIKLLQDYDEAIDSINMCVHKINYCLSSQTGSPICEGATLNFAEISDVNANSWNIIVSNSGRVSCIRTLEFLIKVNYTSECDGEFDSDYVREAIRQLICRAIDLHTFDGVEVMGEPELNVTILSN